MPEPCCCAHLTSAPTGRYRRALWIALAVNFVMFRRRVRGEPARELGVVARRCGGLRRRRGELRLVAGRTRPRASLAVPGGVREGVVDVGVRRRRDRTGGMARILRSGTRTPLHGHRRRPRFRRERSGRATAVRASRRQREHAVRLALLPQRRAGQPRSDARCAWRVRHRVLLPGPCRGCRHRVHGACLRHGDRSRGRAGTSGFGGCVRCHASPGPSQRQGDRHRAQGCLRERVCEVGNHFLRRCSSLSHSPALSVALTAAGAGVALKWQARGTTPAQGSGQKNPNR